MHELIVPRDLPSMEQIKKDIEGYPELDAAAIHAVAELMNTARAVEAGLEKNLGQHGLSLGRHVVMWCVEVFGAATGISPAEIADQLGVTRATVTGLLDALERDGLVVRRRHKEDGRRFNVTLTPKGRARIEHVWPLHYGRISEALRVLDEREKLQLVKLLRKIREQTAVLSAAETAAAGREAKVSISVKRRSK